MESRLVEEIYQYEKDYEENEKWQKLKCCSYEYGTLIAVSPSARPPTEEATAVD